MRDELEEQVSRLMEEAERPMRVEEIIPHLSPVMPSANDVAEILAAMLRKDEVERDGSFYARSKESRVDEVFQGTSPTHREAARIVVDLIRQMDERTGRGAPYSALLKAAAKRGVDQERVFDIVTRLKHKGEAYMPEGNTLRMAK